MREIKFRAWFKNQKLMAYFGLFDLDENYLYWQKDKNGDYDLFIDEENTPIMQYTGLKDKNGKEIYEGDIVEWMADSLIRDEVIFEDSCFMCFGESVDKFALKVIGNIYENSELLKVNP